MNVLLLMLALSQGADEIVDRLEAKAAAARGLELRTRMTGDAQNSGEHIERTYAEARIEVSRAGTLWDEMLSIWIGPERKHATIEIGLHLYERDGLVLLNRRSGGGPDQPYAFRLRFEPKGGLWKDHPGADPWLSRASGTNADGMDPMTLYALLPGLFFSTEAERKASETGSSWVLECRRAGVWGPIVKRFAVRKSDLALTQLEVEATRGNSTYRYVFEADGFHDVKGFALPAKVRGRHHDFSKSLTWSYVVGRSGADLPGRSKEDLGETLFATLGKPDKRELDLRRHLHPNDSQLLVEFAWAHFPRTQGWHYRYFNERQNNRWMLRALRDLVPESAMAREEWLSRTWKADDPDFAHIVKQAPAPLLGHASVVLGDRPEQAESMARQALASARDAGTKLVWTRVLCLALAKQGKRADAASEWMALSATFSGEDAQAFIAELALAHGIAGVLDADALRKRVHESSAALALLHVGSDEQFCEAAKRAVETPRFYPLVSEFAAKRAGRKTAHVEGFLTLADQLATVRDADTLMAAASLRRAAGTDPAGACRAALEFWEKEAQFTRDDWNWARTTLRMLRQLEALQQHELQLELAARFISRLREAKVSDWLRYYRWGETVAAPIVQLLQSGQADRFIELAASAPEAGWRIGRVVEQKKSRFPVEKAVAHLRKTRDSTEAELWLSIARGVNLTEEETQGLLALAYEIAPHKPSIVDRVLQESGETIPVEAAIAHYRKIIDEMKAGKYSGTTGGNYGMLYDRLANLLARSGKLEEAAAMAKEMVRAYPDIDSMSVVNIGSAIGGRGRKDLERELYIVAARHNAHLRPFSAKTILERLEAMGEHTDAYALCVRTLGTWTDDPRDERDDLEWIRAARLRVGARVRWEDVFGPFLDRARPPLKVDLAMLAGKALKDLADEDLAKRDMASALLRLIGPGAAPLLRKEAYTQDLEIRNRIREIIEKIYVDDGEVPGR